MGTLEGRPILTTLGGNSPESMPSTISNVADVTHSRFNRWAAMPGRQAHILKP
jgi:hypothetical protein